MSKKLSKEAKRWLEVAIANTAISEEVANAIDDKHVLDFSNIEKLVEEAKSIANFSDRIDFETVSNILVDYSGYPNRPIIETWVLDNGDYVLAEPEIVYDETNETVSVSFNDNFETGYLIIK